MRCENLCHRLLNLHDPHKAIPNGVIQFFGDKLHESKIVIIFAVVEIGHTAL